MYSRLVGPASCLALAACRTYASISYNNGCAIGQVFEKPKFVERDPSQLYLLPPDIRDWVPEDDLAHFVLEAVERVPMSAFRVNERGTGSAQYHPRMMLALLIYCYAHGIFGSRRIERATYRDLGVRYVAADCHPDHDTICAFRGRTSRR